LRDLATVQHALSGLELGNPNGSAPAFALVLDLRIVMQTTRRVSQANIREWGDKKGNFGASNDGRAELGRDRKCCENLFPSNPGEFEHIKVAPNNYSILSGKAKWF
jgi:hypothetical protein